MKGLEFYERTHLLSRGMFVCFPRVIPYCVLPSILARFFLHATLACDIYGLTLSFHRYIMAAESPKCLNAVDGSFTTKDRLRQGKLQSPLGSQSKAFKGEELSLDSVSPIDPKRISWCCIESRLFAVVPIHF